MVLRRRACHWYFFGCRCAGWLPRRARRPSPPVAAALWLAPSPAVTGPLPRGAVAVALLPAGHGVAAPPATRQQRRPRQLAPAHRPAGASPPADGRGGGGTTPREPRRLPAPRRRRRGAAAATSSNLVPGPALPSPAPVHRCGADPRGDGTGTHQRQEVVRRKGQPTSAKATCLASACTRGERRPSS